MVAKSITRSPASENRAEISKNIGKPKRGVNFIKCIKYVMLRTSSRLASGYVWGPLSAEWLS